MDHLEQQLQQNPKLRIRMQNIERHTREVINSSAKAVEGVITIPVVFHVVYDTEAKNISDAQVQSQIDILYEDFRRINSDAGNTPADFQPVASDIKIQFCLASTDPNGQPTSGITRTETSVTSFGTNDDVKFNANGGKDAWPAADYLNFWVCDLSGDLLGYAQFPGTGTPATDGVVCDYLYTGNN